MANHLGHSIDVQRQYYRLPIEVPQLTKVSQLILASEQGCANKYKNQSLNYLDVEDKRSRGPPRRRWGMSRRGVWCAGRSSWRRPGGSSASGRSCLTHAASGCRGLSFPANSFQFPFDLFLTRSRLFLDTNSFFSLTRSPTRPPHSVIVSG